MIDFILTQTGAELQNLINKIAPTEEKVTQLSEEVSEVSEDTSLSYVQKIEGKYLTTSGDFAASSGDAGIFVFEVLKNTKALLVIPKTGNQYHAQYGFNDTLVDSGHLASAYGLGDESKQSILIDFRDVDYKYLYVSARPSAGAPRLYIKSIYEEEIKADTISSDMLKVLDEPRFLSANNVDLNELIQEVYIFPEYITMGEIKVRGYSKGIILGCFDRLKSRLWAVREHEVADNYTDDIAYPLVVAVTTSSVAVGTQIGYIVYKNVEGFRAVTNDMGDGELLNLGMAKNLFLSPKIFTALSKSAEKTPTLLNGVGITLPSEITAVVGDNMQIYWRSIISAANPYIFDIYAVSSVGKSFPRYYEFKPTADMVGNTYNLDVYVKINDGTIVAQRTATIKVVATMDSPSSMKNILCIGASATAGGQWVGELNRRLTATSGDGTSANPTGLGLSNITFVGRKVGTLVQVPLEATGGWTVQDYASQGAKAVRFYVNGVDTISLGARYSCNGVVYVVQEVNVTEGSGNIRCTMETNFIAPSGKLIKITGSGDAEISFSSYEQENYSPFWNSSTNQVDFVTYANEFCNGHIDVLVWHCGVNDLVGATIASAQATIDKIVSAYRNIIRSYHNQFPNGKIIISSVPVGSVNGGFAANYGASAILNYFVFTKKVQMYAQALDALCSEAEFSDFVFYSPVLEEFDAENNYPVKDVAVNNRSSIKEKQGSNAVHPIAEGSYQVADAIYRAINTLDMNVNEPMLIEPNDIMSGVHLAKGGSVIATSSPRSVATFPIEEGKKYELYVPKTGNEYSAVYCFGNNGEVATGYINTTTGVGNEQPQTLTFVAPSYKYVYVCYTNDSDVPTLTRL